MVHVRRVCQVTPSPTVNPFVLGDARLPRVSKVFRVLHGTSGHIKVGTFCGQAGNEATEEMPAVPGCSEEKSTRAKSQTCLCHFQIDVTNPATGASCPETKRTNCASYHYATIHAMSAAAAADAAAAKVVLEQVQRHSAAT